MASGFTPANTITCDERHSDLRPAEASYRLEIHKNLCVDCAITHQDSIKGLADSVKWTCQKHTDKTAELFCVTHDHPICHVCAVTSNHAECKRDDINDVRKEREKELAELICRAKARGEELKQNDEEIKHLIIQTTERLRTIRDQLSAAAEDEKSKIIKDRAERDERINADYDEQIRELNEMRNERLKQTRDEAEEKLQEIRDEQYSLEEQINRVERGLKARKIELMPGLEELASSIRDGCMKAEILLIKQENLMKDFNVLPRQMNEYLDVDLSRERLDRLKEEIKHIKFRRSGLLGKIEGLEERWVEIRSISLKGICMNFLGIISSDEVVAIDRIKGKNCIFTVHLDSMTKIRRFSLSPWFKPVCYNPLSDGGHVFGTYDNKLVIYDQHWNHKRTIDTKYKLPLIVTVDKDGMILAAEKGGDSISVFSPNDEQCLYTINMPTTIKDFKPMSTGDVIVQFGETGGPFAYDPSVICVFDRSGVQKCEHHFPDLMSELAVDLASDCVFALSFSLESKMHGAWEILSSDCGVSRCITEWPGESRHIHVPAPGLLIVRRTLCFTIYKRLPRFIFNPREELQESRD